MSRKSAQIALLVAMSSVLFAVESLFSTPFPWMRIGLANVITLLALQWWGLREALIIVVLRVLVGSLLVGKFLHPLFLLSLSGGLVSTVVMSFVMVHLNRSFSLIGVSLWGALSKNMTQLAMAYAVYVRQIRIVWLLPSFILTSVVSGVLVGFLTRLISERLNRVGFPLPKSVR